MKNFLSITDGKLVNDGLQPDDRVKLERLLKAAHAVPSFSFILEHMGLDCCLEAMQAAPYSHEKLVDKALRLLALDAAHRVTRLWEHAPVRQDGLKQLMRAAHLYAHGELDYDDLQAKLWETSGPIMAAEEKLSRQPIPLTARDCALLAASENLIPSLFRATESLRQHHANIAKGCVISHRSDAENALRFAWEHGGAISFGAAFGVTSSVVLAAAESEAWHVAYTVADELIKMTGKDEIDVSEDDMADFARDALAPTARAIAGDIVMKGARRVIVASQAAGSFEIACELAQDAARRAFRECDCDRELYERMSISGTALAAACYDFSDEATYAVCDALHWFHEGSFIKDAPLSVVANEIAESVARDARTWLCSEETAYAAAAEYAVKQETSVQEVVLERLLKNLEDCAL